jgi:hypothetical protein
LITLTKTFFSCRVQAREVLLIELEEVLPKGLLLEQMEQMEPQEVVLEQVEQVEDNDGTPRSVFNHILCTQYDMYLVNYFL